MSREADEPQFSEEIRRFLDGDRNLPDNHDDVPAPRSREQGSPAAAVEPTYNRNETVDSEAAPELTKRKRQRVSPVWNSFRIVKGDDGTQSAKCNHCGKEYKKYSSKKGTSNLLQHIKNCTALSRRNGHGDKPADETGGSQATPVLNREQTVLGQELSSKSIPRMLINQANPPCMLENNMPPTTLEPQLQEDEILGIYTEYKEKHRRSLNIKCLSGLFNITINLWRPVSGILYCCLTLHFIDDAWELQKKTLDFKQVLKQSGSCWETVETLKSMLQDWSIGKNVCSVIVQNTDEEVDEIVNKIKDWLDYDQDHSLPSSRKLFHINCFAHILNLLVTYGLQEVRDTYLKMMNSLFCVRDQTAANEENFRKAVDQARSEGKKVTSEDMPTNDPLSFQMLGSILGLREVFSKLLSIDSAYRNYSITQKQWDKATSIFDCLKLLDEAIQSLSAITCLTTNMYFPKICKIYWDLQCLWGKIPDSDVQSMAHKMKVTLKKFWDDSIESLATAAILDPRFKFDIVQHWCKKINGQDTEEDCKRISETLVEIYNNYAAGILDPYNMLDSLGMPCTSAGDSKSQKTELDRYLEEPTFRSVKEFDILGWWRVNTPNFPTLAKMARDFLAIPISAAQANPVFNNEVMKIHRAFLDSDSKLTEAFISTRYWILENQGLMQPVAGAGNEM